MDAALDFLAPYLHEYAYLGLLLILSVGGFGLPIPEELVLVAAGLLVAWGSTELVPTLMVCGVGMIVGDGLFFAVGRRFGLGHLHGVIGRLAPPDRVERVIAKVHQYGLWVVFFGRYLTGVRPVVFLGAGASGIPFARFAIVDGASAAVALAVWVAIGYHWSAWIELVLRAVSSAEEVIIGVALSVLLVLLFEKLLIRFGTLGGGSLTARTVRAARIPIFVFTAVLALVLARQQNRNERAALRAAQVAGVSTEVKDLGSVVSVLLDFTAAEEPVDLVFVGTRDTLLSGLAAVGLVVVAPKPGAPMFARPADFAVGTSGTPLLGLWRTWFIYRGRSVWLGRFLGPATEREGHALGTGLVAAGYAHRTSFGPHVRGTKRRVVTVLLHVPPRP